MPDIVIPINKTVDISKGTLYTTLGLQNTHDQLIQGQNYANVLNVSVYDGAEPVALSGACMGYFVRQQDGSTVTVAGTISGNVATVEFPSFVYAYTGRLTITLNVGGTSLVQIATTVRVGSSAVIVDPGNVLPNLDEIQQIMLDVEDALNQLSGALEASQAATQAANTAAGTANTAAQGANEAASAANTAASALNGMTATANTLEPGEPATAVAELVSGAWKITFGIPQGVQGIQGVRGTVAWHGTAITGTSTTPTAYSTGIDSAIAGDLYLYSGTDSQNIGNVYTCTQGGDASTALWAYMSNWRGATGAGSVSSVNSVLPDTGGDVELTAADVGARPDTWMPTAADVGACDATLYGSETQNERVSLMLGTSNFKLIYYRDGRLFIRDEDEGGSSKQFFNAAYLPNGLIYQTTAQALEEMTQEQQEALYAQGYRAIKATNNGTVVLLGLESDGSLSWIGCNQDTRNLLDNPNFAIAQAGYNGAHGTATYVADRWKNLYPQYGTASVSNGALIISGSNCYVGQAIENVNNLNGQWITFAANVDGADVAGSLQLDTSQTYQLFVDMQPDFYLQTASTSFFCIRSGSDTQKTVENVRLLYGSYTPKTLPPWEEPDYVTELIKCQRYYIRFNTSGNGTNTVLGSGIASGATTSQVVISTPCEMRIVPSCTFSAGSVTMSDSISANPAVSAVQVRNMAENQLFLITTVASGLSENLPVMMRITVGGYIDFSADL